MTNNEIINFLNQVRKILLNDKSWLKSTVQPINEAFDRAISALREQDVPDTNAGDMISRRKVIDEIIRYFHYEYYQRTSIQDCINCFIEDILTKLPSAQPEPQWIPVTERLPEKYGNYLISIHGEDEPDIGTINPNNKRGWSLCDASGFYWASDKSLIVTAWMPFPEPYRAERRTDGELNQQTGGD